jgi:hypothetical protein
LAGAGASLSPMGSFVHAIPDVSVFKKKKGFYHSLSFSLSF